MTAEALLLPSPLARCFAPALVLPSFPDHAWSRIGQMLGRLVLLASLALLASLTLLGGCTAPTEPLSLPSAELPAPTLLEFTVEPEAPRVLPPMQTLSLLATNPEHPRWAASDGRRAWVGEGAEFGELARDHATQIHAIAVDDRGALWLLDEHDRLTQIDASGERTRMPELPITQVNQLIVAGPRLVLAGSLPDDAAPLPDEPGEVELDEVSVLAISDDQGRSWRLRRRPSNLSEFDDLSVAPDGSMQLMDGQENACGGGWQARWISQLDRPGWTELAWPLDSRARSVGAKSWSYGFSGYAGYGETEWLVAVDRKGEVHELFEYESSPVVIHDGRRTVMLVDGGIWSIEGRRKARLGSIDPAPLEHEFDAIAIAHDGAVLLSFGTTIQISTPSGWTSLELANS